MLLSFWMWAIVTCCYLRFTACNGTFVVERVRDFEVNNIFDSDHETGVFNSSSRFP